MSYGLLNLPAPLFGGFDSLMAAILPPTARLVVWALLGAIVSMWLYYVLTPQARIGKAKKAAVEARQRLNAFDGEFADAWPLIRAQFTTSFKHIGLLLPGTILASLPVLCLLIWMETAYGHTYPEPGDTPAITITSAATPTAATAQWIAADDDEPPTLRVRNASGQLIARIEMDAPVPVVHKRQWWNWLVGNPVGYLPDPAPLKSVHIDLPRAHYLPFGPDWARSWATLFLAVLMITSVLIHRFSRIK